MIHLQKEQVEVTHKIQAEKADREAYIREFNRAGMAVLLVEQNAYGALAISSRAYVLELGRVGLEGTSAELMNDVRVRERYLGVGP